MPSTAANHILRALPEHELHRLEPYLQPCVLEPGTVICGPRRGADAYFPTTAVTSVQCSTYSGDTIQVALTGREGVAGVNFDASGDWRPGQVVVQHGGRAWRLPRTVLRDLLASEGALRTLLLGHAQYLMVQIAQTALCSRMHRLDQQLCRWIAMSLEASGGNQLEITQQQIASTLGVRREGVSSAVGRLQTAGLLYWGRGRLKVTDPAILEANCCECHGVLRSAAARLLSLRRDVE